MYLEQITLQKILIEKALEGKGGIDDKEGGGWVWKMEGRRQGGESKLG